MEAIYSHIVRESLGQDSSSYNKKGMAIISNQIKPLVFSIVVRIIHFLHLNYILRYFCYFWLVLKNPKRRAFFKFNGIDAQFYARSSREFPFFLIKGFPLIGERRVLKELLQALQLGDIAYDIGASIGSHAIFMAKKVGEKGRIIAFEPEIHSFETLNMNVTLNGLKNMTLMPVALGDSLKEGIIYRNGSGLGSFNILKKGSCLGEKVRISPGDILVQNESLPLPNVVKIDVEGYEYFVVRGLQNTLKNKNCKMVCCEIHPAILPPGIKSEMVIDLLKSYGFRCFEPNLRGETFHIFCYR